jgi:F0F1-type ATP synthase membrane subunit b/b'
MENLGIDIKLLIAQLTNFVLFYLIFKKFIANPFTAFLKDEKQKEQMKEKLDEKIKELGAKEKETERTMREKLEDERKKLLKEAREEAEKLKKETLKKAQEEAERIKAKALDELERDKKISASRLKKEAVDLSISLVETGLKNYLSPNIRKEITELILKNSQKMN